MNKNINNILFCFKVFYILASEFFLYFIFKDYSILIDNLTKRLSSINILYVKIFQAFALNNHFIDDVTNNKLLQFTDNAPWTFNDYNLTQLNEISNKYNIVIKFGYEIPINSGMISLVFKGYRNDDINHPVIIKMKRKNIEIKLNEAIDNLSNPNDKYDLDLIAIRIVMLELLKRSEEPKVIQQTVVDHRQSGEIKKTKKTKSEE